MTFILNSNRMNFKFSLAVLCCFVVAFTTGDPNHENTTNNELGPFTHSIRIPKHCNLTNNVEPQMQDVYELACRYYQEQTFIKKLENFCKPTETVEVEAPRTFLDHFRLGFVSLAQTFATKITGIKQTIDVPALPVTVGTIQNERRLTSLCKLALITSVMNIHSDATILNEAAGKWANGTAYLPFFEKFLKLRKIPNQLRFKPLKCKYSRNNSSLTLKWEDY